MLLPIETETGTEAEVSNSSTCPSTRFSKDRFPTLCFVHPSVLANSGTPEGPAIRLRSAVPHKVRVPTLRLPTFCALYVTAVAV